ncbi:MAG: hypothetical protein F4Y26_00640 [Gammaproteobacteria bacterium]|nr:hypothetical protein [Gammaproteobacteria bacterium]
MRTYPLNVRRQNASRPPIPLSADQCREFLANGFLVLRSSLPESYHRTIFERFDAVADGRGEGATGMGHFGNNLLPLIPELIEFFHDPVVRGALGSVLGPDYSMHPHRALHRNPPGSDEQEFHKDSYWGYTRRVRNHRPWWVMVMYFPQDTELVKGPTAVMAGSQHLNQRPEGICTEVPIAGAAGSFVLIHYDIWHRKMRNQTDLNRYMFKFEFTRMAPPRRTQASPPWQRPEHTPPLDLSPVWQATWDWLSGGASCRANGKAHAEELGSDDEATGINAGYRLGTAGQQRTLLDALDSNAEPHENKRRYSDNGRIWQEDATVRNAAHGLVQLGCEAVPGLQDVALNGTPRGRKHAAFALGEIGSDAATSTLIEAMRDDDVHVRIAAAEAIGILPPSSESRDALLSGMCDSASEVRFDAALSLVRATAQGSTELMAGAVAPLEEALYDTNRYVSGYAAEALERIGTAEALGALLPFLRTARWCPHTDNQHPF